MFYLASNTSDFIHPEDAAALRQMEGIQGFAALVKKVLAIGIENLQYGLNMASSIRLSEKQLPQIYRHLPPICQRMGIPEPEFYLQMNLLHQLKHHHSHPIIQVPINSVPVAVLSWTEHPSSALTVEKS